MSVLLEDYCLFKLASLDIAGDLIHDEVTVWLKFATLTDPCDLDNVRIKACLKE